MGDGGNKNKTGCVSCTVTVKSCVLQQLFKSGVVMNVSARSILFTLTISFCKRWQTEDDCCKMELRHNSLCVKSLCKLPRSRNVYLWRAGRLTARMSPDSGMRAAGEKMASSDKWKLGTKELNNASKMSQSVSQHGLLVHRLGIWRTLCQAHPNKWCVIQFNTSWGFFAGEQKKGVVDSWADLPFNYNYSIITPNSLFNYFLSLHQGCSLILCMLTLSTNKILKEQGNLECLMRRDLSPSRLISTQIH